jgi:methylated-DNA-[protein]-cysteine S-methyltransferase
VATVLVSAIETPFGPFYLASRAGRFFATHGPLPGQNDALGWGAWRWGDVAPAEAQHAEAHDQIDAYFDGSARAITLPLELAGSELTLAAWQAALAVPYGGSVTYGGIAARIDAPGRARAVGRAMAHCPLPLLIPLHRVVGAGEKRCGDFDDWQRRMQLLRFEREVLASDYAGAGGGSAAARRSSKRR